MTTPPEDLVLVAKAIDRDAINLVSSPDWSDKETHDTWRKHVPPSMRKLWGRLGLEARLAAYVVANEAVEYR